MFRNIYKAGITMSILILSITNFSLGQDQIEFGKDQCSYCNMIIKDRLHAAVALDNDGVTYKFDAIEGMINFLKDRNEQDFEKLLLADYGRSGEWTDALTATFLKSPAIPSPMGAFLSAFGMHSEAQNTQKDKGGDLFTWSEIKQKFKNSSFGSVDHHHGHGRPDAYAPIGIMGDHLHAKGDIMFSIRYMNMNMSDNMQGSDDISNDQVLADYMVVANDMKMSMMMFGFMYAPSDNLTVMLMQNFLNREMDLTTRMGMGFTTSASGIGDMKLSVLYGLFSKAKSSLHLNGSLNLPFGNIEVGDATPMDENAKLPYAMQLGTGTIDATVGLTFKNQSDRISWGIQQLNTFRTSNNNQGYAFGDVHDMNAWVAYRLGECLSISSRVAAQKQGKLDGADEDLNRMMVSTADPANYGHTRVRTYVGFNLAFPESHALHNFKFGTELGSPVYQNYEGIQMNENISMTFGIRYSIR